MVRPMRIDPSLSKYIEKIHRENERQGRLSNFRQASAELGKRLDEIERKSKKLFGKGLIL